MEEPSSQISDTSDGMVGSHLAGHLVLERLGSSQESTVYRARAKDDSGTVVLKVVHDARVGKEAAARLKFEYELLSSVKLKGSTRPLSFERAPGLSILVMEDFRGIDLRVFARRNQMALDSFFTLALGIVSGLSEIHDAMLIHQDIKPPNILVSPDDLRVQIIDFSIATKLTRREPSLRDIQHLKGTPAYIAPEQTGAMNRSLDYRCDLYSLGATFYYMLTGRPPFRRKGLWDYVRAHIAETPVTLSEINQDVPELLSEIISKLLSKYPEERYQSATGLRLDLEKAKDQWELTGSIKTFMLGVHDVPSRFEIPERLYGRDDTIACIQETFEKVRATGRTEFIMIHGAPGVGKTAVVREVYKTLVRYGGISTTGKFDQFSRAVPYLGFTQAFDGWVDYIEDTSLDNQNQWKQTLRSALGKNSDLMTQLSPKLSRFIGDTPHRDNLDHLANRDRFDVTVNHFIDAITPAAQPLVIFLDDMQWADQGSLDLLSKLVTSPQKRHLLIIGSYRDNELAASLRMQTLVNQTKEAGGRTQSISIGPLFEEDVLKLLENTLHTRSEKCLSLGKLLMKKTNGNAFFLRQLLTRLYEDHVINFDSQNAQWLWNINEINSHPISANVVNLMIEKLKQLPNKTQRLLRAASCMGNQFDLRILSLVSELSIQDAGQLLWHALNEGVLIAFSDKTKFFQPGMLESMRDSEGVANSTTDTWLSQSEDIMYRFVHDAVQEAAHAMLEMDEEQQTKLRWARVIQADAGETQLDEVLINMMQAFNVSAQQIDSPEECLTL
ncbi:MAG: AAA family ATPase, partial [Deltaproteobacteria bacterium]|nr:AAA family ATPase [Deltaproteobacteria bacterium]